MLTPLIGVHMAFGFNTTHLNPDVLKLFSNLNSREFYFLNNITIIPYNVITIYIYIYIERERERQRDRERENKKHNSTTTKVLFSY